MAKAITVAELFAGVGGFRLGLWLLSILVTCDPNKQFADVEGPVRVGFEADYLSVSELKDLEESAPESVTLVPIAGVIEKIRLVKDSLELEKLEEIAALANQALEDLLAAD